MQPPRPSTTVLMNLCQELAEVLYPRKEIYSGIDRGGDIHTAYVQDTLKILCTGTSDTGKRSIMALMRNLCRLLVERIEIDLEAFEEMSPTERRLEQFVAAAENDLERDAPASEEAHNIWYNILDNPNQALPLIQQLIDERDS